MILEESSTLVSFLYVTDRERALEFYSALLGLDLHRSDNFGDFIKAGQALIRVTVMPGHTAGSHPVLGWEVPDIVATVSALRECGVRFTIYEGMGQDELGVWTAPDGKAKVAWFSDPDGNVLSLSQARA